MKEWEWFKLRGKWMDDERRFRESKQPNDNWRWVSQYRGGDSTNMRRKQLNANLRTNNSPHGQTSVLLCDDHPLFLLGLKTFLEKQNGIRIVGEASDPDTLLRLATKLHPQIIIMDMSTAKQNDFSVLHQLTESCPDTKVIIITGYCDPMDLLRSIRAGAQGYLFKSSDPTLILNAIATIRDGKPWIQREFTEQLFDVITDLSRVAIPSSIQVLSSREREILKLVAEGKTNKDIAKQLHLSVQTVKVYLTRIFHKLGVRNRVEAAQYALIRLNEWLD